MTQPTDILKNLRNSLQSLIQIQDDLFSSLESKRAQLLLLGGKPPARSEGLERIDVGPLEGLNKAELSDNSKLLEDLLRELNQLEAEYEKELNKKNGKDEGESGEGGEAHVGPKRYRNNRDDLPIGWFEHVDSELAVEQEMERLREWERIGKKG